MVLNPQAIKVVYVCEKCKKTTEEPPASCDVCGGHMFVRTTIKRVIMK